MKGNEACYVETFPSVKWEGGDHIALLYNDLAP